MIDVLLFDVPAAAARAIRIDGVVRVAQLTGVRDCRLDFRYVGGLCRISCSTEIAYCLVAAFRDRVRREESPADVVIDCAQAAGDALLALDAAGATWGASEAL